MTDPSPSANPSAGLPDVLERAAEQTYVGPPPLDRMKADARGARRRRTGALVAAAAATAVIAGGTATLAAQRDGTPRQPGPPASSQSPRPTHPAGSTDLTGSWTVSALNNRNGMTVMPEAGHLMTLTFADGLVEGDSSCNAISGTYLQGGPGGHDLRFPRQQLSTTLVGCGDEPPLLSRLSHVRHVSGAPGMRYLKSGIGMVILELHRR
jgi:hypothetical protein